MQSFDKINVSEITLAGYDIQSMVIALKIFEDIGKPTMSGTLTIGDTRGIVELLGLLGGEDITISFSTYENTEGFKQFTHTFQLYKIEDLTPSQDSSSMSMNIHFQSYEFMENLKHTCNQSFGNEKNPIKTNDIVNRLCEDMLFIDADRLNIHETKRSRHYVAPSLNPFDVISYLASTDSAGASPSLSDKDSNFLFFENRKGFNFVTWNALIEKELYNQDELVNTSLDFTTAINASALDTIKNQVIKFSFPRLMDRLAATNANMFSSKTVHVDFSNKAVKNTFYDYDLERDKFSMLDNDKKDSLANNRAIYPKENVRLASTKFSMGEDWLAKAAAKNAMMTQYNMLVTIAGDSAWMLGQTLSADVPSPRIGNMKQKTFDMISGDWVVGRIVHNIMRNQAKFNYSQTLDLYKGTINK